MEQTASAVGEKTTPVPPRKKSKTSTAATESGQTKVEPDVMKSTTAQVSQKELTGTAPKEERKKIATIVLDAETAASESEILPPKRKSKTKDTKPSEADKSEDNKSEPDGMKSSSTPQGGPEPTETIVVKETELSATKRSKGTKLSPEHAAKEVTETKLITETAVEEEPKNIATIILDEPETSTSLTVTSEVVPPRRKAKGTEVSTVPEREQNQLIPPKRKSKGSELPLKSADPVEPQEREELEGQKLKGPADQNKTVVSEEAKMVPARRKTKNGEPLTTSKTVTPIELPDVESKQTKKELNLKSSTTEVVTGPPKKTDADKGKLSPTKRKSKGEKLSQKMETSVVDESGTQKTEAAVVQETIDELIRKSKEELESKLPTSTEEFITVVTEKIVIKGELEGDVTDAMVEETKVIPIQRRSKESPDSQKPSSEEVIKRLTETAVRGEGLKISPKPVTVELKTAKVDAESQRQTRSPGAITTTPESQKSEAALVQETIDELVKKSKEELESTLPTSAEEFITVVTENIVIKGGLEGDVTDAIVEETKVIPIQRRSKQGPESQRPTPSEEAVKRLTETAVRGEGMKLSQKPGTVELKTAKVDAESQRQTASPGGVTTLSEITKTTTEIQQRYLVLDLPEMGSTQISQRMAYKPEKEPVAGTESKPSTTAEEFITVVTEKIVIKGELEGDVTDAIVEETKVIPIQRRPKQGPDSQRPMPSEEVVKRLTETAVRGEGMKLSQKPELKTAKVDAESQRQTRSPGAVTTTPESQKSEAALVQENIDEQVKKSKEELESKLPTSAEEFITVVTENIVIKGGLEGDVTDAVVEKTKVIPIQRRSKKGPDSQKTTPSEEVVKRLTETAVRGEGMKLSPKPGTVELKTAKVDSESQRQTRSPGAVTTAPESQKSEAALVQETTDELVKKSREELESKLPTSAEEFITVVTENIVIKGGLEGDVTDAVVEETKVIPILRRSKKGPDSQKTTPSEEVVKRLTETAVRGEGMKLSQKPGTVELKTAKVDAESQRQTRSPGAVTTTPESQKSEAALVQETIDELVKKSKEELESKLPTSAEEFITVVTENIVIKGGLEGDVTDAIVEETKVIPIQRRSKQGPDSQRPTPSEEAVKRLTETAVRGEGMKLSQKPGTVELKTAKVDAESQRQTASPGGVTTLSEITKTTTEIQQRYLVLDLPEMGSTQISQRMAYKPEKEPVAGTESKPSTTAEEFITVVTEKIVIKGELEGDVTDAIVEETKVIPIQRRPKQGPDSQRPMPSEEVVKRLTETAVRGEGMKLSQKPELKTAKVDAESQRQTRSPGAITTTPESQKSEAALVQENIDEQVKKSKEELESTLPTSAEEFITIVTENIVIKGGLEGDVTDAVVEKTKVIPIQRRSKKGPDSQKTTPSEEVVKRLTDTAVRGEGMKLSQKPGTVELKTAKVDAESQRQTRSPGAITTTPESQKSEAALVQETIDELVKTSKEELESTLPTSAEEFITVVTENIVIKGGLEGDVTDAVVEETKVIPIQRRSKKGPESQKTTPSEEVVKRLTETAVRGEGMKLSQKPGTVELKTAKVDAESQRQTRSPGAVTTIPESQKSEAALVQETIDEQVKKSKEELESKLPTSAEEFITVVTEKIVIKGGLEGDVTDAVVEETKVIPIQRRSKKGPDSQKTTPSEEVVKRLTETAVRGEGMKLSPKPGTVELKTAKVDAESQRQTRSPGAITTTPECQKSEAALVQETIVEQVKKSKEELESTLPTSAEEFITVVTENIVIKGGLEGDVTDAIVEETKVIPIQTRSKQGPDSHRPTPSEDVVKRLTETAVRGEGMKLSQKPGTVELKTAKVDAESQRQTRSPGAITTTPESQKSEAALVQETIDEQVKKSKEELESKLPTSAEEFITVVTENIVIKGGLEGDVTDAVVEETKVIPILRRSKQGPDSQRPTPSEEVVKRLTETAVRGEGMKLSPKPGTAELKTAKVDAESQRQTRSPGAITTTPESQKSEAAFVQESTDELVKKTKEELESTRPTSAEEFITVVTENTVIKGGLEGDVTDAVAEETKVIPIQRRSKKGPDSQKTTPSEEVVKRLTETAVRGEGMKLSQKPGTVELKTAKVDAESQRQTRSPGAVTTAPESQKSEAALVQESIDDLVKKSKEELESKLPTSAEEFITVVTENIVIKGGLEGDVTDAVVEETKVIPIQTRSKQGPESQKTTPSEEVVKRLTETAVRGEGMKLSQKPGTVELKTAKVDAESQRQTRSPGVITTTPKSQKSEAALVQETIDELVKKSKEELESTLPTSAEEFITVVTEKIVIKGGLEGDVTDAVAEETKVIPIQRRSKKGPDSQKTTPSEEVVKRLTETAVRGEGMKLSQKPGTVELKTAKVDAESQRQTRSPGAITTTPECQKSEAALVQETIVEQVKKSKEELESTLPTSAEEFITVVTENIVIKGGLEGDVTDAVVEETKVIPIQRRSKQGPDSQRPTPSEEVVKRLTETASREIHRQPKVEPDKNRQPALKDDSPVSKMLTLEVSGTIQELPGKKVATFILDTPDSLVQIVDTKPLISSEGKPLASPVLLKADTTSRQSPGKVGTKPLHSEVQETKDRSTEALEPTTTKSTEKGLSLISQTQPPTLPRCTDKPQEAGIVDNLTQNTAELQQRYLVLDLPEMGSTQISQRMASKPNKEPVAGTESKPSNAAEEFITVVTEKIVIKGGLEGDVTDAVAEETKVIPIQRRSKKGPDSQKTTPSEEVVKRLTETAVRGEGMKLSQKPGTAELKTAKVDAESQRQTRSPGAITTTPESQKSEAAFVQESTDELVKKSKEELESTRPTSAEEFITVVTENTVIKGGLEGDVTDAVAEETKVIPIQRRSKKGPDSQKTTPSEEVVKRLTETAVRGEGMKLSQKPGTVELKTAKVDAESQRQTRSPGAVTTAPESQKSEAALVQESIDDLVKKSKEELESTRPTSAEEFITVVTENIVIKGGLEGDVTDAVVEETKVIPIQTRSKQGPESQKTTPSEEVVKRLTETAVRGEGMKLSQKPGTVELKTAKVDAESQRQTRSPGVITTTPKSQKSEAALVQETIDELVKKSKEELESTLPTSAEEFITVVTEKIVIKGGLEGDVTDAVAEETKVIPIQRRSKKGPDSQKTTPSEEVVKRLTETAVRGEGMKLSQKPGTVELKTAKVDAESQRQTRSPGAITTTPESQKSEAALVQETIDDLVKKSKEELESKLPTSAEEFITVVTENIVIKGGLEGDVTDAVVEETKLIPIQRRSKQGPDSQKTTPSEEVVKRLTETAVRGEGMKLSPKPGTVELKTAKVDAESQRQTRSPGAITTTPESQKSEAALVQETIDDLVKKSKEELESKLPTSAEEFITVVTEKIVIKGGLEGDVTDAVVEETKVIPIQTRSKQGPESQKTTPSEEVVKRLTDTAVRGEGMKLSQKPGTVELKTAKVDAESQRQTRSPGAITTTPESQKSEAALVQETIDDLVKKSKEELESKLPTSAEEFITVVTEKIVIKGGLEGDVTDAVAEETKVIPIQRRLKNCPDSQRPTPSEEVVKRLTETAARGEGMNLSQKPDQTEVPTPETKAAEESPVKVEDIQMKHEVRVLQLDVPAGKTQTKDAFVSGGDEPRIDNVQSDKLPETKGTLTADITVEKGAVQVTTIKLQERNIENKNSALKDSTQPTAPNSQQLQPRETETEIIELSLYEQDKATPSQAGAKTKLFKTTQDRPAVAKGMQMEHPEVPMLGMTDEPFGFDETGKRFRMEKVQMGPEVQILELDIMTGQDDKETSITIAKEPRANIVQTSTEREMKEKPVSMKTIQKEAKIPGLSSSEGEKLKSSPRVTKEKIKTTQDKDELTPDVQPDKSTVKTVTVQVQETITQPLSGPSLVPGVQTEREIKDVVEKKQELKDREKSITQKEGKEKMDKMETQPTATTTTSGEVRLHSPQQVYKTDEVLPTSLQAVQKSTAAISWGETTLLEGLPPQEKKIQAEASAVKTEKPVLEEPEGSAMRNIFKEIQLRTGSGPSSPLTEGKPVMDTPEGLIPSTSDLDSCLNRVVSKVLSCKTQPGELSPSSMAQQLEEAQKCRKMAVEQMTLLSQLRGSDAENREALDQVEDQLSTAIQDATAVIKSKEAQLQDVTEYCKQNKAAETALEKLAADLDAVKTSPEESSSQEAKRLNSLQKSMEGNRTVLGQLLLAHTKVCPHLSQSEKATAETDHKNLQQKWRDLERAVERSIYHTNMHSQETNSLLLEIESLQEDLEGTNKDLKAMSPSGAPWDCKKAQQLMVANAEVNAAKQKYNNLQQQLEALLPSSRWETETKKIEQELQKVKDQLSHTEELVSSQTQNSSNPTMEKIIVVMRDGLAWAKQTESDIGGRTKRVALLPEEVHQQLKDLKKLQSEVLAKQGQLESLVEEVTELLPQLDQAEEVPMVRKSLESLEDLSKSTTEKLAKAVRETESGLQTREKLSEQIADLDSWVVAQLQREASRSIDTELRSPTEFDRRVRQIQDTLAEAEKQSAVGEALLMKSKDIASELSITENCQLYDKLTNLKEDIQAISSYEKANQKELDSLTQTVETSKRNLVATEKSLKQMLVDLNRHKFPITRESLQAFEPFKQMILEHKSQVDLLQPWIPQEKSKELYSIISELHSKMVALETKVKDHEGYLNTRQFLEDLRENVQEQVPHTKDDSRDMEEKYKVCQTLLVQFPLMRYLSKEAHSKLQTISADLYPSQLNAERQRLKQNEDTNDTLEMTLYNNLSIIERNLLKELDLNTEREATRVFLQNIQQELQTLPTLEPNDTTIDNEYRRLISLKKNVESRVRALEVLEQKKGDKKGRGSRDVMVLKKIILSECDKQMLEISKAKEYFRNYISAVKQAAQFLRGIEVSLLPPHGSSGPCSERVEETQQSLETLQQQFQTHVENLQSQNVLHPYLSPQKVEQLQENILSQLLVRMSTIQAKGHVHLDRLSRCAENHKKYTKCHDEIMKSLRSAENNLSHYICQKVTCLADCTDQQAKLKALSEEVEVLQKRLEELKEWCPEQSCCGGRVTNMTALWKRLARLRRCTLWLSARSTQRVNEWSKITNSVEKASTVLDQVEKELPDSSKVKASTEELQDLLQPWEQYQDRLDCEHRALSALELRTARLVGVPAHLEQAPSIPICQRLQAMQGRYGSVKQRSMQGLEAARLELEEREKVREELQGIKVWMEAANGVLSEMEKTGSTQQLQEVHSQMCTQKALLQRIMESLRMKYTDMNTPVPVEIEGQQKEVKQSLHKVELKVGEAVKRSGPVHRLGAKLSEILVGLRSVQRRLEQRSPSVVQAKVTQKRVWDELDVWHSCMAALEVAMQDLEKPEEALSLTERLVEVQQLHSQLAKQAEQRTTLLSKIHMWLQEHQEMIKSSKSWMSEAQTWLASPCTYTTAKDLSSHVQALKTVLNDSAQIRSTLQGFSSVLTEMSQVCDITKLQEQLIEADHEVSNVQDSFAAPLSQLEHAAAEVEAIESEVRRMENNVSEIKTLLTSPEAFPSPKEESLKAVEKRIQSMRRTIAEIQKCKPGLCLPEKAEETLVVFTVVDQLQGLLLELEKKVPALFIQQPPTPVTAKAPSTTSQHPLLKSGSKDDEKGGTEQGQIRIAHVEEDVLRKSGAALLTVERSSAEQRRSWTPEGAKQREHGGVLQAVEATEKSGSEEQRLEEGGGGVLWWLWDAFLGSSPEEPMVTVIEETNVDTEQRTEQTEGAAQGVEGPTDSAEASSSEALSKPLGTVRTQSLPESMVNTTATVKVSKAESAAQQRCVVS
ncbi:microtubule-associated protein futsch-like isoform X3 [Cheilinus undulatus]|uniref:microtubule-associated protein futsch-like isoform X3 n=1 Tax=Cheilinus undulatus TaxID=241271 RepID=UPI001BD456DC|nr:microtubule-associated protein futsch-like isoform X3 [Cheilinus undulatus]